MGKSLKQFLIEDRQMDVEEAQKAVELILPLVEVRPNPLSIAKIFEKSNVYRKNFNFDVMGLKTAESLNYLKVLEDSKIITMNLSGTYSFTSKGLELL